MRKLKLCIAASLVLVVVGSAQAVPFVIEAYQGVIEFNIRNWDISVLYPDSAASATGAVDLNTAEGTGQTPGYLGAGASNDVWYDDDGDPYTWDGSDWRDKDDNVVTKPVRLEDTWGIFQVSDMSVGSNILWQDGDSDAEIYGIFYGGVDVALINDDTTDDLAIVQNEGIHFDIYIQKKDTFSDAGGENQGTGGRFAAGKYNGIGYDVSDGDLFDEAELFLRGMSTKVNADYEYQSTFSPSLSPIFPFPKTVGFFDTAVKFDGTGSATAFFDQNPDYYQGAYGTADALLSGRAEANIVDPAGNWLVKSFDPLNVNMVPEPMTVLGVFGALAALGGYVRRRRIA